MENQEKQTIFKSGYFYRIIKADYNPFTPNVLEVNDHFIEYKRRNWYLISVDSQKFHFQNIVGVDIDKHLFGATVRIVSTGNEKIYVHGFSKGKANQIKEMCSKYISKNTQRGTTEAMAEAIAKAVGNTAIQSSVADELKKLKELLDNDVITKSEYDVQKNKLLNN